jgi:hypothetical protein
MSAAARPMPLSVVAMSSRLIPGERGVLNESDGPMIAGFFDRWLGVVSWLRGVSDGWEPNGWEAVPR